MKMTYSDGTVCNAADFADAMEAVKRNHPDAVAYQDGCRVDEDDDVTGNGRILIWSDERSSRNDDGSRAIAEISEP